LGLSSILSLLFSVYYNTSHNIFKIQDVFFCPFLDLKKNEVELKTTNKTPCWIFFLHVCLQREMNVLNSQTEVFILLACTALFCMSILNIHTLHKREGQVSLACKTVTKFLSYAVKNGGITPQLWSSLSSLNYDHVELAIVHDSAPVVGQLTEMEEDLLEKEGKGVTERITKKSGSEKIFYIVKHIPLSGRDNESQRGKIVIFVRSSY